MALQKGEVVEGKVTGLTNFGAFIELPDHKVGMVHISEVSNQFVKEISDFLEKGQIVRVKVLNIDDTGKISLSIKQVNDDAGGQPHKKYNSHEEHGNHDHHGGRQNGNNHRRSTPNVWNGQKKSAYADKSNLSFEEMMAKFKAESDDKLTDLKHATESKHGGFSRRGGNKRYS